MGASWSSRLARWWADSAAAPVPDQVLELAALHLFDTVACAAGAADAEPVAAARRIALDAAGASEATLWFTGRSVSMGDAVLGNGVAVRFLDANDVFLGAGPGGHPSDNIPVAVAAGERFGASGRDVLVAIALSYDLVARLRRLVFRPSERGRDWHEVSISGPVAAAMTAYLAGGDAEHLADAIAIGTARGYSLKEIRRGQISMMKAAANALVALDGVLAARLALAGFTGPPEVFEGGSGLLATIGLEPVAATIDALCAPPEWAISRASMKPFPAFGTSQAALAAAVSISARAAQVGPGAFESVEIRLPDTAWTREYVGLEERKAPQTRETADHSMQFLVAVALLDGDLTQVQYERRRWEDDDVVTLMERTTVVPDAELIARADTAFPAKVIVRLTNGNMIERAVLRPPGSPSARWTWPDVAAKFGRLDRTGLTAGRIEAIGAAARGLRHGVIGDLAAVLGRPDVTGVHSASEEDP